MPTDLKASPMLDSHRNVRIRIEILKIYDIDCAHKKFSAELLIESKWNDFNLNIVEYDQSKHWCFKMNEYDMHKHWNPKLYVKNQVGDSREQSSKYKIHKESNFLIVTETKTIKGQFWQSFKLNNFPFDFHELNLIISSKLNSNQITLIAETDNYLLISPYAKKAFTEQSKWTLYEVMKLCDIQPNKIGIAKSNKSPTFVVDFNLKKKLNHSPVLIATAFCARKSGCFIWETFLLALFLGVLSLTCFGVSKLATSSRLELNFLILISNVVFKWCSSRTLVSETYSSTLVDKYSLCCIVLVCLQAVWHSILGVFYTSYLDRVDFWMFVAFSGLFLSINLAALFYYLLISRRKFSLKYHERRLKQDYLKRPHLNKKTIFEDDDDERF